MKRLFAWLRPPTDQPVPNADEALSLTRQLKALELELADRDRRIQTLTADLQRAQARQADLTAAATASHLETLMRDLAPGVAQFATQSHLVETENRPVESRDLLAVTRRLVRTLQQNGLVLEGEIGQVLPFNPDRHAALSGQTAILPGQPVRVRMPGVLWQSAILLKTAVEPAGEAG